MRETEKEVAKIERNLKKERDREKKWLRKRGTQR